VTSAIEAAYRTDAARILGAVAHYTGDLQLAEDAVQEAFVRALAQERAGTVLRNPAAWITTSARRIAVDYLRRARTAARAIPALAAQTPPAEETDMSDFVFTGDERLELILMMCHPELAEEARIALALRFVCAVPTREVAAMLLVPEATMAARLTRAKKRLHDSEIRFGMDDDADVSRRLPDALTVISLVYTTGYAAPGADTSARLRADAIELARDAVRIRPGDAEASGLLGLLLLTEARQSTRLDPAGDLVELSTADRSVWDAALIAEGEGFATRALQGGTGRFALMAGIAGLHATAAAWDDTDWSTIARLYDGLVARWPSPSARLARLVARGYSPDVGPTAAGAELDAQPDLFDGVLAATAHAARGDLAARRGDRITALRAYREALDREQDAAVQRFLRRRLREVGGG